MLIVSSVVNLSALMQNNYDFKAEHLCDECGVHVFFLTFVLFSQVYKVCGTAQSVTRLQY